MITESLDRGTKALNKAYEHFVALDKSATDPIIIDVIEQTLIAVTNFKDIVLEIASDAPATAVQAVAA